MTAREPTSKMIVFQMVHPMRHIRFQFSKPFEIGRCHQFTFKHSFALC
jgi:hypothetical protein